MTALTHHTRRSVRRSARTRRAGAATVDLIALADTVLRPVLISAAIMVAAIAWSTPAHADPDSSYTTVLNSVGIGNNGPVSSAIAQVGQSICPLLVKPGSGLASSAIQASGNGGLAPTIGGAVAGMVIQAECPNAMTQLSNGDFGPLLQLLGVNGASSSPLGLPGIGAGALPGIGAGLPTSAALPIANSPLQLPGLS